MILINEYNLSMQLILNPNLPKLEVNRQNFRDRVVQILIYSEKEHVQVPQKLNVWTAISDDYLAGPLFNQGTLIGNNYLEF